MFWLGSLSLNIGIFERIHYDLYVTTTGEAAIA